MSIPPLAIIQARMNSYRLPGKILLPLYGDRSLLQHVWIETCEAFGYNNVVIAYPETPDNTVIGELCNTRWGAQSFAWNGSEQDVLGRFYHCAHYYRWHPNTVIVRVTPDDPFKDARSMRRVARGERLPVEVGGEAFTLEQLDNAHRNLGAAERFPDAAEISPERIAQMREHLTYAFFVNPAPSAGPGVWSIDTQENYDIVREWFAKAHPMSMRAPHAKDCVCQDCNLQAFHP